MAAGFVLTLTVRLAGVRLAAGTSPTFSAAFSVAFSAATAVLRALVVAALAELTAFLEAFLVVVDVRLAAVRVRLADSVTSASTVSRPSVTEPVTTSASFTASLRVVVMVAL